MFIKKALGRWACTMALSGCALAAGPAITTISLERDCAGCTGGSLIVLQHDGQARVTTPGHARLGTEERTRSGRLLMEDFERLARLAVAEGFFGLQAQYADPQLQDGPWMSLRIERSDGSVKQVFRRNGAGPSALDRLESAIDAAQQRIAFSTPPG